MSSVKSETISQTWTSIPGEPESKKTERNRRRRYLRKIRRKHVHDTVDMRKVWTSEQKRKKKLDHSRRLQKQAKQLHQKALEKAAAASLADADLMAEARSVQHKHDILFDNACSYDREEARTYVGLSFKKGAFAVKMLQDADLFGKGDVRVMSAEMTKEIVMTSKILKK